MKGLSTQNAILLAGALVAVGLGVGLAVGLRGRASSEAPLSEHDVPRTQPVSPGPVASAPSGVTRGNAGGETDNAFANGAQPSATAPDARTRTVSADASKALAAQLPSLRTRCWEPARAKSPEPARVTLILNYTFGADGKQLARGISDVPGASRPDVTRCVASMITTIDVPPPGDRTYVEVPITLP